MTIENKTRHILVFECEIDNRCVLSVKIRSNELDISQKLNNSPYNTKINYSCKIPQSFLNCTKTIYAWKSEVWTMMLWYPQTHTHPLPLSRTVCREKNREKITFLMPNNYVTGACALKRKNRKRNEWGKKYDKTTWKFMIGFISSIEKKEKHKKRNESALSVLTKIHIHRRVFRILITSPKNIFHG